MTCEIVAAQIVQIRLYVCAHAIAAVKWRLQVREKKKLHAGGLSAYKIQKGLSGSTVNKPNAGIHSQQRGPKAEGGGEVGV